MSIDVYDSISRKLQFKITSCSNATNDTIDYHVSVYNHHTVAGQWTTFTFDYQVYDSKYGAAGNIQKGLTVYIGTDGDAESLVKFDNLTVTETVKDGYYMFALCAVTPKHMGDNVSATLYATKDGASVSVSKEEYSIKEYCEDLIELYPDDEKLMTLVSNLLAYGAASQEYADYKTDSLVTSGLTLTPSTFEPLKEDANKLAIDGESAQGLAWTSASLTLGSKTTVRFSFIAENAEGLQVKVTVGGREQVFNVSELIAEQGTTYEICFTDVMVTEYDSDITAEFVRDGETVGETLTYSVNIYIYEVQDNTDAEFAALVKAIYLYGKAAADYAAQD